MEFAGLASPAGATGVFSAPFLAAGASVFLGDCEQGQRMMDAFGGLMKTDLCDRSLSSTNDTEERAQDTKERDDTNTQSGRSLWLRLDGQDGVNFSELDERE